MQSNDMLTRYLHAVGFWLPPATKQDILAEISEDLHLQIDDRNGSLGRLSLKVRSPKSSSSAAGQSSSPGHFCRNAN